MGLCKTFFHEVKALKLLIVKLKILTLLVLNFQDTRRSGASSACFAISFFRFLANGVLNKIEGRSPSGDPSGLNHPLNEKQTRSKRSLLRFDWLTCPLPKETNQLHVSKRFRKTKCIDWCEEEDQLFQQVASQHPEFTNDFCKLRNEWLKLIVIFLSERVIAFQNDVNWEAKPLQNPFGIWPQNSFNENQEVFKIDWFLDGSNPPGGFNDFGLDSKKTSSFNSRWFDRLDSTNQSIAVEYSASSCLNKSCGS